MRWASTWGKLHGMKRRPKRKADMMDSKVLMDYHKWVAKHLDQISRKYPHKVIAVYRGKLVPGLRKIQMLPGCGHWTQQERPNEVSAAIIEFIQALPSRS